MPCLGGLHLKNSPPSSELVGGRRRRPEQEMLGWKAEGPNFHHSLFWQEGDMFSFSVLNLFSRMSGKSGASAFFPLPVLWMTAAAFSLAPLRVFIDVRGWDPQVAPGYSTFSFALWLSHPRTFCVQQRAGKPCGSEPAPNQKPCKPSCSVH